MDSLRLSIQQALRGSGVSALYQVSHWGALDGLVVGLVGPLADCSFYVLPQPWLKHAIFSRRVSYRVRATESQSLVHSPATC